MNATALEPTPTADVAEVLAAIQILFPTPNQLIELRIPAGKQTKVGFYRDHQKLADTIAERSGKVGAVYYTLNQPAAGLYTAKNADKLVGQKSTADCHIVHRDWLLVDCDPVRVGDDGQPLTDQKVSATDAEKAASLATAKQVLKYLTDLGWPAPVTADSGNGFHLLYRLDLTSTLEVTAAIRTFLERLAAKFNTSAVKIDTVVYNAARITKAYGSMACKGSNTPDRPHRKSALRNTTGGKGVVTLDQIQAAVPAPQPKTGVIIKKKASAGYATSAGDGITPDKVDEFLDYYGVEHTGHRRTNAGNGYQWTLTACPFNPEHNNGECSVFLNDDGGLGYKCFHNSCSTYGWKEMRAHLETSTDKKFCFDTNKTKPVGQNQQAVMLWKKGSDFKPELLEWLWDGRLPRRSTVAFHGDMSTAKTTMALDIIARGSVGKSWIDGQKNTFGSFESILLSAEDDPNTIIIPRIIAAGGDPGKVHFPDVVKVGEGENQIDLEIRLDTDIRHFKTMLAANPAIKLIVIDPLSNYAGDKNIMNEQEIRQITMPLARLAQEYDIVVICIFHHNKKQGVNSMQKVIGAGGNIGACRMGWTFLINPENPEQKFMLQSKKNLGNFSGITYTTKSVPVLVYAPDGNQEMQEHACIKFLGENKVSAETALAQTEDPKAKQESKPVELLSTLCPVGMKAIDASTIYEALSSMGYDHTKPAALMALSRARKKLGIVTENIHGTFFWSRPAEAAAAAAQEVQ